MKIKVKYFGLIAEAIGVNEEDFHLENNSSDSLVEELLSKHEVLKTLDYQVALNHTIIKYNHQITEGAEMALLPPFAGG